MSKIESEFLFNLSNANPQITALNNYEQISSSAFTIEEKTSKGLNLSNIGSFIAIWRGLNLPASPSEFLGVTELTSSKNSGEYTKQEVAVKSGVDLGRGQFTIGLFLNGNDISSLSATVFLSQGRAFNPQPSSIFVTNPTNSNLTINYFVPSLINPYVALDWVYLYKGGELQYDIKNAIHHYYINETASTGTQNLSVSLKAGDYIIELNPGNKITDSVSASYSFTLS